MRGTTEYTTNVFVDSSGRLASVCSCPVGRNCKHGVALALCAAEKLKNGEPFSEVSPDGWLLDREAILAEHQIVKKTKSPPPQPPVCIRVKTNPFDRFTPNGGRRHGSRFSFRVEEAGEVFTGISSFRRSSTCWRKAGSTMGLARTCHCSPVAAETQVATGSGTRRVR